MFCKAIISTWTVRGYCFLKKCPYRKDMNCGASRGFPPVWISRYLELRNLFHNEDMFWFHWLLASTPSVWVSISTFLICQCPIQSAAYCCTQIYTKHCSVRFDKHLVSNGLAANTSNHRESSKWKCVWSWKSLILLSLNVPIFFIPKNDCRIGFSENEVVSYLLLLLTTVSFAWPFLKLFTWKVQ